MKYNEKLYENISNKLKQYSHRNNLRNSAERDYILRELCTKTSEISEHFDADELFIMLKSKNKKISRATVFRNLALFVKAKILRKVQLGENHSHYEIFTCKKKRHDHLICIRCGKIVEFTDSFLDKKNKDITKKHGFKLVDYKFEIYGICEECQKD